MNIFFHLRIIVILVSLCLSISACHIFADTSDGPPAYFKSALFFGHQPKPYDIKKSKFANPPSYKVRGHRYYVKKSAKNYSEVGLASWYGKKFHGHKTATGEVYSMYQFTAAHRTLPIPTFARVTNLENGKSIIVKINDRGPFYGNRIIDLSYAAAKTLGTYDKGTAKVRIEAITSPNEHVAPVMLTKNKTNKAATQHIANNEIQFTNKDNKHLLLQLGAFKSKSNAVTLKNSIKPFVHSRVSVKPTRNHGRTLYKVLVGPFNTRQKAEKISKKLFAKHITNQVVVR